MVFKKKKSDTSWRWSKIPHTHTQYHLLQGTQAMDNSPLEEKEKSFKAAFFIDFFYIFFLFWGGSSFSNQSSIINKMAGSNLKCFTTFLQLFCNIFLHQSQNISIYSSRKGQLIPEHKMFRVVFHWAAVIN